MAGLNQIESSEDDIRELEELFSNASDYFAIQDQQTSAEQQRQERPNNGMGITGIDPMFNEGTHSALSAAFNAHQQAPPSNNDIDLNTIDRILLDIESGSSNYAQQGSQVSPNRAPQPSPLMAADDSATEVGSEECMFPNHQNKGMHQQHEQQGSCVESSDDYQAAAYNWHQSCGNGDDLLRPLYKNTINLDSPDSIKVTSIVPSDQQNSLQTDYGDAPGYAGGDWGNGELRNNGNEKMFENLMPMLKNQAANNNEVVSCCIGSINMMGPPPHLQPPAVSSLSPQSQSCSRKRSHPTAGERDVAHFAGKRRCMVTAAAETAVQAETPQNQRTCQHSPLLLNERSETQQWWTEQTRRFADGSDGSLSPTHSVSSVGSVMLTNSTGGGDNRLGAGDNQWGSVVPISGEVNTDQQQMPLLLDRGQQSEQPLENHERSDDSAEEATVMKLFVAFQQCRVRFVSVEDQRRTCLSSVTDGDENDNKGSSTTTKEELDRGKFLSTNLLLESESFANIANHAYMASKGKPPKWNEHKSQEDWNQFVREQGVTSKAKKTDNDKERRHYNKLSQDRKTEGRAAEEMIETGLKWINQQFKDRKISRSHSLVYKKVLTYNVSGKHAKFTKNDSSVGEDELEELHSLGVIQK